MTYSLENMIHYTVTHSLCIIAEIIARSKDFKKLPDMASVFSASTYLVRYVIKSCKTRKINIKKKAITKTYKEHAEIRKACQKGNFCAVAAASVEASSVIN